MREELDTIRDGRRLIQNYRRCIDRAIFGFRPIGPMTNDIVASRSTLRSRPGRPLSSVSGSFASQPLFGRTIGAQATVSGHSLARGSVESGCWSPVPGQEVVEAAHGVAAGHALKHALQIGEGLDVVELDGGDEGADGCPAVGAAVRSGK
jgi:hypothetical protein